MKLHELIALALAGKQFTAHNGKGKVSHNYFLGEGSFTSYEVTCNWTVTFKREPRVLWVCEFPEGDISPLNKLTKDEAAADGKPIKFIEVLE